MKASPVGKISSSLKVGLRALRGRIHLICHTITLSPKEKTIKMVATGATALFTVDVQHIKLADEIAEDDCSVAGHSDTNIAR